MYRESRAASQERDDDNPGFFQKLFGSVFLLAYFVFLPIILTVIINWAAYAFTQNNFYQDAWMMPTLLLLSTFLAGALMRQKMEDETGGMGLFFLGMLALVVFAWLTQHDIRSLGGVYSRYMPKMLPHSVLDFVYLLPALGVVGMLFYKYFTLKHYS